MEILIIGAVAVWTALALRSIKKNGAGCCSDCEKCASKCNKKRSVYNIGAAGQK